MSRKNNHYTSEAKYQAVGDYLSGKGSLKAISKKYGLRDTKQLRNWIKMYNGHTELKSYTGGSCMTKGRNTTYEERIALVKECIENWCCTIKVDIGNSKSQYIEKDKQEATKDGSESTKIQHGI